MEHAIPMRLSRDIADISKGKNQSKWRVVWRFCFEGIPREHVITLTHSVLSGKKRIEHNGRPVFNSTGRIMGEFSHRMLLKDHRLGAVITSTNTYELFVDGRRFEELPEASFSMMDAWRREALPGAAAMMASNGSARSEVRGVDFADFTAGGGSGSGSRRASGSARRGGGPEAEAGADVGTTAFDIAGGGDGFDDDDFNPRPTESSGGGRPRPMIRAPSARKPAATTAGAVWEAVTGRADTSTQIRSMDDEDDGQAFGFSDSYGEMGPAPAGRSPMPARKSAAATAATGDDAFGWGSGSGFEQASGALPAPGRTPARAAGGGGAGGGGGGGGGGSTGRKLADPFGGDDGFDDDDDAFAGGFADGGGGGGGDDVDAFGEGAGEFADASGVGAAADPFAEDLDDVPPNVTEEVSMLNFETDAPRAGGGGGCGAGAGTDGDGFDDDDLFAPAPAPAAGGAAGSGGFATDVDDVFAAAPEGSGSSFASGAGGGAGAGAGGDTSRPSELDEATLVNLEDLTGVRRAEAARLAGRAPTKPTTMSQLRASRRPTGGPVGPAMLAGPTPPYAPGQVSAPVVGALAYTAAGRVPAAPPSSGHDPFSSSSFGASPPRGGAGTGTGMMSMGRAGGAGGLGGLDAVLQAEAAPRPRMTGRRAAPAPAAQPTGGIDINPFA